MKTIITALGFSIFLCTASSAVLGQKPIRIKFARGATVAVMTASLRGYSDEKRFVIRVRSGQTLSTSQISNPHITTIYVQDPSGHDVGDSDASCNNRREISLTEAGDYLITVIECRKADPWRGTFKFRITVR